MDKSTAPSGDSDNSAESGAQTEPSEEYSASSPRPKLATSNSGAGTAEYARPNTNGIDQLSKVACMESDRLFYASKKRNFEDAAMEGAELADASRASRSWVGARPDPPADPPASNAQFLFQNQHNTNAMDLLLEASASAKPLETSSRGTNSSSITIQSSTEPLGLKPSQSMTSTLSAFPTQESRIEPNPLIPEAPGNSRPEVQSPSVQSRKGGIFDDAEPGVFEYAVQDQPSPAAKGTKVPKETTSPSKGGIFDDAEEDMDFEAPAYERKTTVLVPKRTTGIPALPSYDRSAIGLLPPPPQGSNSLQPKGKANGSPKVPSAKGTAKKATGKTKKKLPSKEEALSKDKTADVKKKKAVKPTKRILVARKEKEAATLLLANKDDLATVIAPEHCDFLGKEFWIFTVQQLECVLQTDDSDTREGPDSATKVKPYTRTDILVKLAKSKLTSSEIPSRGKADPPAPSPRADREATGNSQDESSSATKPPSKPFPGDDKGSNEGKDLGERVAAFGGNGSPEAESDKTNIDDNAKKMEVDGERQDEVRSGKTEAVGDNGAGKETGTEMETQVSSPTLNGSEASVDNGPVCTATGGADKQTLESAEAIIQSWQKTILEWKNNGQSEKNVPVDNKFLLDGPVSYLFPAVTLNFFASMPLRSLYDFLSLKKTETGAVISLCMAWRKECRLPDVTPLSLAKHFIGISLRAETAISSVPPVDSRTRKWISDPIVVLTGAAREFVVDERGVFSGSDFLEARTKDLAMQLVQWRDRKGLPPLKGSGKVAMISGWKATVKEAIDLEEGKGKVLKGVNLQALVEKTEQAPIVKEEKKVQVPAKPQPPQEFTFDPRIPDVDAALHSPKFLEETLDPEYFSVLQSVGVKTAVELFAAEKKQGSPLARAVAKILPDPSTFELTIFDWCQVVRKKLSGIRRVHTNKRKSDGSDPEDAPAPTKPKVEKVEKDENSLSTADASKPALPRPKKEDMTQKDPFLSLSAVTQTFLGSLGITTAEGFLTSRTTDLSNKFIEWRANNNMPVLKGLGAIASVSGWKAQVRKIAKERGLEKLAVTVPEGAASYSPGRKAKSVKERPGPNARKLTPRAKVEGGKNTGKKTIAHPGVLFGKPKQRVAVECVDDPELAFLFDITIRKATSASGVGLFISYAGAYERNTQKRANADSAPSRYLNLLSVSGSMIQAPYPVLKDLSKQEKLEDDGSSKSSTSDKNLCRPFSSLAPGCGLVELGNYDVWPLPHQGEAELAFREVERFIRNPRSEKGALKSGSSLESSNVLVGKDERGKYQYYLYLQEPIEKGQTVELQFSTSMGSPLADGDDSLVGCLRQQIDGIISRLSVDGLRTLLNFISKLAFEKIDKKLGLDNSASTGLVEDPVTDPLELANLVVSRRRVHWTVLRIKSRLQDIEEKGFRYGDIRTTTSVKEFEARNRSILWSPRLANKLREHPAWDESVFNAVREEVLKELEPDIESNGILNSFCRKRWCPLARDAFESFMHCFANFSTLLDGSNPQEKAIDSLQSLALHFAIKMTNIQPTKKEHLDEIALFFEEENDHTNPGNLPFSKNVIQMATTRAYNEALALCDSPAFDISTPKQLRVVATEVPDKAENPPSDENSKRISAEVAFRTIEDTVACKAVIHWKWYIKNQMLQVFDSLLACSATLLDVGVPLGPLARIAMQEALKEAQASEGSSFDGVTQLPQDIPLVFPSNIDRSDYQPHSFQLFLGLVWPTLRKSGWRLEAGDLPSDFSFIPPGQPKRRRDKRSRLEKQERTKARIQLAKAANDLGLGFVPKLTKRLFVNTSEMNPVGLDERDSPKGGVTVDEALKHFLTKIEDDLPEEKEDSRKRAKVAVEQIRKSFDELFPMLLSKDGDKESVQVDDDRTPSKYAGCEYLARLLLVLPSILCQSGLSMRLIDDTTIILKELADFLASNHAELFDRRFHPEKEVYIGDKTVKPVVASRLQKLRPKSTGSDENFVELDEAILPEDRPDLTDFVETVMSQVIPCRATQDDVGRKNRRISLGYAGLMCRHCLGANGEGRYFFSTPDSLTTASTVIEKHIQKCPKIAAEIKQRMASSRTRHAEQRRGLPSGAQAAYFLRLWERLRSSKVKDTAATLHVLEMKEEKQDPEVEEEDDDDGASDDFSDHVGLLEFLKETSLWSQKTEVMEAMDQYYECLEYGGRIYNTDEMPKCFSAEWLLAQVTDTAHTTMG